MWLGGRLGDQRGAGLALALRLCVLASPFFFFGALANYWLVCFFLLSFYGEGVVALVFVLATGGIDTHTHSLPATTRACG